MFALTQDGGRIVHEMAQRHKFSEQAVTEMIFALTASQGRQAQFNIPELGGMGQWSASGMLMIGDMFNHDLQARVGRLCADLAKAMTTARLAEPKRTHQDFGAPQFSQRSFGWPEDLGAPSSAGAQNNMNYAYFPKMRRLAVRLGDLVTIYDTGKYEITGFSQQQGVNNQMAFTTPEGTVSLDQLQKVGAGAEEKQQKTKALDQQNSQSTVQNQPEKAIEGDIFSFIEKIGALHEKGLLTDEEFSAKKTELLQRL